MPVFSLSVRGFFDGNFMFPHSSYTFSLDVQLTFFVISKAFRKFTPVLQHAGIEKQSLFFIQINFITMQ